ncbi:MAG TPA: sigma-70 family RNA polymerase sigma factor [Chthoniobacteraceae bacterium]|jgi:RNA polymerase sigma-70 factor (ECF subfamily)|nr:sigma-70 family polymerase sigma factor [Chthoniobacter sp.]HEV7866679.1 sigma-70 family RNA polymerase sigma factor [Chthoniobacteraceae bacterium]
MKNPVLDIEVAHGNGTEDELLMEALVQRDPDALEELYQRYGPVLRGVVLRVLHDETDAEDVLQETFLQLWSRAENYSVEKGKPLGWLITLARRRAIDRLRQRSAYRRATDRFEVEAKHPSKGVDEIHSVERNACQDDLRHLLGKLMHRLPPSQREAIDCAFFQSMSQRQIAQTLNLPLGTVKTRIELGLRKLANVVVAAREKIV